MGQIEDLPFALLNLMWEIPVEIEKKIEQNCKKRKIFFFDIYSAQKNTVQRYM